MAERPLRPTDGPVVHWAIETPSVETTTSLVRDTHNQSVSGQTVRVSVDASAQRHLLIGYLVWMTTDPRARR